VNCDGKKKKGITKKKKRNTSAPIVYSALLLAFKRRWVWVSKKKYLVVRVLEGNVWVRRKRDKNDHLRGEGRERTNVRELSTSHVRRLQREKAR
jgi:hypothetical protein